MSEPAQHGPDPTRGLVRWLLGGLAAGGLVLGLLVAAYAIGYHRGQHSRPAAASTTAPAPTTTTTTTTSTTAPTTQAAATTGAVTVTPQLVARGKALFTADACAGCHSLTGAAGAGPPLNGISGKTTKLADGRTATVDDAYLERAIADPDAQIVDGYHAGIMGPAIAGFGFDKKPDDVRALIAYIKSQH